MPTFGDVFIQGTLQIQGTADLTELSIQANSTQTNPIQVWQDSGANQLARITSDGRFQIGNNIVSGPTDALIQANYNPTGTIMPTSVWHAPGSLNVSGTLAGTVNWVFHELLLAGSPTLNGVQNALYTKLTNSTTGAAGSADLRAATFQTISSGGGTATPVGKATGLRAIASNAGAAYLSQAIGVEATISNDTGGSISSATAFSVTTPINNTGGTIGTLYGMQIAGLTQGVANYALLTNQGVVSFGDKVGINTTSPQQMLHINQGNLRFDPLPPPGAATAATAGGSGSLAGSYRWVITFVTAGGETLGGTPSNTVFVLAYGKGLLSSIPIGSSGTISRKIYRTTGNNGPNFYYVATLPDNSTTTYTDLTADSALGILLSPNDSSAGLVYSGTARILAIDAAGAQSVSIGASANVNNTDSSSVAVGAGALNTSSGYSNVAVGTSAGNANTVGNSNVFVGTSAGTSNTSGSNNVSVGLGAGLSNATGSSNVFIGYLAGSTETGSNKLYISNSSTGTPLILGDFTGGLTITSQASSAVAFTVRGASSGTVDLQEWKNSSNTVLASISSGGALSAPSGTIPNFTSSNISITGGIINSTVIGGTGAAAATFTTLNVGATLNGSAMSTTVNTNAGTLGSTATNELAIASIGHITTNNIALGIRGYRLSTGSSWLTEALILGMDVDGSVRAGAYISLSNNGSVGIAKLNPAYTLDITGTFAVSGNIGFFGKTNVAQQASTANVTNNVTSGGTTDQIDNFTSLSVYATDAPAIRNDIYQLARKVKQINDALRLYGLLS